MPTGNVAATLDVGRLLRQAAETARAMAKVIQQSLVQTEAHLAQRRLLHDDARKLAALAALYYPAAEPNGPLARLRRLSLYSLSDADAEAMLKAVDRWI